MVAKKTQSKSVAKRKPSQRRKPTRKTSRPTKGWGRLWPALLGGTIVIATCWLLFKVLSSRELPAATSLPEGFTVHGIDVSHHQGKIDWELLRNQATIDGQPLSFAFIKATEGTDLVDSHFKENFAAAKKHGILRSAYHFYRAGASAKQQAEHFIRQVKLEAGDLPPVLDVEVKPASVSQENFRQGILEWLLRVEQHYGVKPILYTYHSFHQQYMNDSVFNLYPYWIAHYYVDSVRYRGPWAFWQHSDSGQLPGIKEKVDLDLFRGSFEELQQLTIGRK